MGMEIYYFSGTGNSLHVARELQKRIPDTILIPMVNLSKKDVMKTGAETIGFVFPVHLMLVPVFVRRFLNKLDVTSAEYIFTIMTREGSSCLADIYVNSVLKKKGKRIDSIFIINMTQNTPTGLKPTPGDKDWVKKITKENILKLETEIQSRLDLIQKAVVNKEKYPEKNSSRPLKTVLVHLLSFITDKIKTEIKFYSDQTCNGCGICEKVCLSGKIKMNNGNPFWQKEVRCYYCYACFNFCPEQSILVEKIYTQKDGRYHHPGITVNDIAGQK